MTNLRNSDSAYSICFGQVLLKLFTFLINTADKEIYNIFNSFLFPYYFNTNWTNKQTNKHTHTETNINRVLIIKIYVLLCFTNFIFICCRRLETDWLSDYVYIMSGQHKLK